MPKKIILDGVEYYLVPTQRPGNKISLSSIGLKPLVLKSLKECLGIEYLEECLVRTEVELLRQPYLGRKALNVINDKLVEVYGFRAGDILRIRDLVE